MMSQEVAKDQATAGSESSNDDAKFEQIADRDRKQNVRLSQRFQSGERFIKKTPDVVPDLRDSCCWFFKNKMRFLVVILSLMGILLSQMARVVLNVTVPLMTYPIDSSSASNGKDSCPWPSQPDSPSTSNSTDINDGITRFHWTGEQRDNLLGSFYYTYAALQMPAGIVAERYGSKYVLLASVAISGGVSLATPYVAGIPEHGITILIGCRLLVGMTQGGVLPAIYALINRWTTATEAIVIASLLKTAFRAGALLASAVPYLVTDWQTAYYITGAICMVWSIGWLVLFTSKPQHNSFITVQELYRIARKKRNRSSILASIESGIEIHCVEGQEPEIRRKKTPKAPSQKKPFYKRSIFIVLTSNPVIGLVLSKFATNLVTDFITVLLPTYIRDLYHGDKGTITSMSFLLALIQIVSSFPITWLVKHISVKKPFGITKTQSRRLFQGSTCFGSAICLCLLTLKDCSIMYASCILALLAIFNMLSCGGESLVPYDLSDKYPGTIMALANSFSTISGFMIPNLRSIMIGNEVDSISLWSHFLWTIAGANIIGGIIFITMVKAEKVDPPKGEKTMDDNLEDGLAAIPLPPLEIEGSTNEFSIETNIKPSTSHSPPEEANNKPSN